jgi:hypothetical protein
MFYRIYESEEIHIRNQLLTDQKSLPESFSIDRGGKTEIWMDQTVPASMVNN